MMASLKVLLVGDNPNIILLASRFQLADSVDLYHVSDLDSNQYEIESYSYGLETFQLTNHFNSINQLIQNTNKNALFDLIILSATSLQQLSTISCQLLPLITNSTKIFVESTGSVQLEPFVEMSINSNHKINVLSIISDFEIRHIKSVNTDKRINVFKQFGAKGKQNTIYLGDSSSKNYSSTTQNLLNTFERLFKKLFPKESINLCNFSSKQFLKVQWELSLTQICFDPLLIMLEETNPQNLPNLILAKPLISGLVSEVITLINKMGIELNPSMNSESKLLKYWQSLYSDEMPPLVYNFINKTSPLNIDLIWLQIILLADDQNIKTPYLEFLYSMMSQVQKINNGESKWFTRNSINVKESKNNKSDEIINDLKIKNNTLEKEISQLKENLKFKNNQINENNVSIEQLREQLKLINKDHIITVNNYESQIQKLNYQINELSLNQGVNDNNPSTNNKKVVTTNNSDNSNSNSNMGHSDGNKVVNRNLENAQNFSNGYKATGTPDLNDLQDMAIFGVSYDDSPIRNMNTSKNNNQQEQQQQQQSISSNVSSSSQNINTNSGESNTSLNKMEESRTLQERELDLKRKELELQERELELQRRALQQQQYAGRKHNMIMPNSQLPAQTSNQIISRNQPLNQVPQQTHIPNMRQSRGIYGVSSASVSALNFNEPISSGMAYSSNLIQPQQAQSQQQQPFLHTIKPTSRKNRASKMLNLRNPSSTNINAFQNNMINNAPPSVNNQSRLNSLSSQSMNFQTRIRNTQQQPQQNIHSASFNNLNSTVRASTLQHVPANFNQQQLQQRQISTSSADVDNLGNVSMNSVVQTQLRPVGTTSSVKAILNLQKQQQEPGPQHNQNELHTQQSSSVPVQLKTPSLPPSVSNAVESSPASFTSNNTSQSVESGKSKKKKFGLFKKKAKK